MAFKELTYAEKLRLPAWQRKRLEIMQRDGFRCQSCKSDRITLNVHHKVYIKGREPWDYPNDNFQTLCVVCHEKHHLPERDLLPEKKEVPVYGWVPQYIQEKPEWQSLINQIRPLQESLKTMDTNNEVLLNETLGTIMKLQKQLNELIYAQ